VRQSQAWPETNGVLFVETGEYRKALCYQYSVDGITYISDRIIFGEMGDRVRSNEWNSISEFPSGSVVTVYYSPYNPRDSTLFTKLLPGSGFNLVLGFGFLMMGCIPLVFLTDLLRTLDKSAHATARSTLT
jgi:hypothetical protein